MVDTDTDYRDTANEDVLTNVSVNDGDVEYTVNTGGTLRTGTHTEPAEAFEEWIYKGVIVPIDED